MPWVCAHWSMSSFVFLSSSFPWFRKRISSFTNCAISSTSVSWIVPAFRKFLFDGYSNVQGLLNAIVWCFFDFGEGGWEKIKGSVLITLGFWGLFEIQSAEILFVEFMSLLWIHVGIHKTPNDFKLDRYSVVSEFLPHGKNSISRGLTQHLRKTFPPLARSLHSSEWQWRSIAYWSRCVSNLNQLHLEQWPILLFSREWRRSRLYVTSGRMNSCRCCDLCISQRFHQCQNCISIQSRFAHDAYLSVCTFVRPLFTEQLIISIALQSRIISKNFELNLLFWMQTYWNVAKRLAVFPYLLFVSTCDALGLLRVSSKIARSLHSSHVVTLV